MTSLIRRRIPTALGSERRRQPALFAAFVTGGAKEGAGPSPKPTLDPRMNFDGSTVLIDRPLCEDVAAAVVRAEALSPEVVALELAPLLEPQPASSSAPASSGSARRAVTRAL
jgi:hypothetical protein